MKLESVENLNKSIIGNNNIVISVEAVGMIERQILQELQRLDFEKLVDVLNYISCKKKECDNSHI